MYIDRTGYTHDVDTLFISLQSKQHTSVSKNFTNFLDSCFHWDTTNFPTSNYRQLPVNFNTVIDTTSL